MSEQVEEDIKVKTKRRAKQSYKKEKKMNKRRDKSNTIFQREESVNLLCKTLSKTKNKSTSPVQPYKQQKTQQKVLTNSKECRIINKLTHREQEKNEEKGE